MLNKLIQLHVFNFCIFKNGSIASNVMTPHSQCLSAALRYSSGCMMVAVCFSKFLYPKRESPHDTTSNGADLVADEEQDGKYELFAEVDRTVREEFKDLALNGLLSNTQLPCHLI